MDCCKQDLQKERVGRGVRFSISFCLGLILSAVGVYLFCRDLDLLSKFYFASVVIVLVVDGLIFLIGVGLLWFRPAISNVILSCVSILFCLIGLEVLLSLGLFDQMRSSKPIWIPYRWQKLNEEINAPNWKRHSSHPYGFNDREYTKSKPTGVVRLAVLGDSFIWGDGLPEEKRWSRRLEFLLREKYPELEVFHWGQCGWSTLDELAFLLREGLAYQIDYLVVGFVSNDPDVKDIEQKHLQWHTLRRFRFLREVFPDSFEFLKSYFNRFLEETILPDYGYDSWEARLYSRENLEKYRWVLEKFASVVRRHKLPTIFVMTPHSHHVYFRKVFDKVIPLFREVGLEYYDLYPVVKERLGGVPVRELWANPANAHPGERLSQLFAEEVFRILEDRWFKRRFSQVSRREE